jgi:glyoxylase-like metal-dependent hydrolase (beta-lactamase superfamily II)
MKIVVGLLLTGFMAMVSAKADATDKIKLYALNCGDIEVSDMDGFSSSGDYAKQTASLASACFLIRHPSGDLLWDTGLPGSLAGKAPMVNGVFNLSLKQTLVEQLASIDVNPKEINYVSISHSHFDHVGQIASFPESTWLVTTKENDAMFASDALKKQNAGFDGLKKVTFDGDHDVFGDGRVVILDMPGHTQGHTTLQVNLADTGPVLISGDIYHQAKSRELKRVPRFNFDEPSTRESIERFEALATKLGAKVIIQHEKNDIDALPKLPKYLQ